MTGADHCLAFRRGAQMVREPLLRPGWERHWSGFCFDEGLKRSPVPRTGVTRSVLGNAHVSRNVAWIQSCRGASQFTWTRSRHVVHLVCRRRSSERITGHAKVDGAFRSSTLQPESSRLSARVLHQLLLGRLTGGIVDPPLDTDRGRARGPHVRSQIPLQRQRWYQRHSYRWRRRSPRQRVSRRQPERANASPGSRLRKQAAHSSLASGGS
jgi:hypothetical protein